MSPRDIDGIRKKASTKIEIVRVSRTKLSGRSGEAFLCRL
jgi:hypothetical protein